MLNAEVNDECGFYNVEVRLKQQFSLYFSIQHSAFRIAPAAKAAAPSHRDPEKPAAHVSDLLSAAAFRP